MDKKVKLVKNQDFFQITTKSVNEIIENDQVVGVEIEGYASTKDKDRGKDIVEPTAFKNALDLYMTNPVVLLQHDTDKPIGLVTQATIDSKGLYIKARITEDTDGVFSKLKNKVLRAFSIGYRIKDYEEKEVRDDQGDITGWEFIIKDLELYEISIVSIPMNPYALTKSMSNCFEVETKEEETVSEPDTSCIEDDTLQEINEVENTEAENEAEPDKVAEVMDHEIAETESEENIEETPVDTEAESTETKEAEVEPTTTNEPVDNTEISEETSEPSENVAETATSEGEIDQAEKAVNVDLQKKAEFDYEAKMLEQDKKITDLTKKLDDTTEVVKACVELLNQLNNTVENTAVKTGFIYERPAEKAKKGYGAIAQLAKSI